MCAGTPSLGFGSIIEASRPMLVWLSALSALFQVPSRQMTRLVILPPRNVPLLSPDRCTDSGPAWRACLDTAHGHVDGRGKALRAPRIVHRNLSASATSC